MSTKKIAVVPGDGIGPEVIDAGMRVLTHVNETRKLGLEFDAVFLIRALEGVLPSAYALKDADELDEELRLLYVALTRARTQLFISYPIIQHRRFSGDYLADPSRFIDDIPETILEPLQLLRESPSPPELGPHDSG